MIPGLHKVDIDGYVDQVKPHIKVLTEGQSKEMQSIKEITTLWVKWKKPVKSVITFDPEDVEGSQDIVILVITT